MAFAVKYRMEWTDQFGGGESYKVDFEKDGYGGGSVIGLGHHPGNAFVIQYDEAEWLVGSEALASFHVNEDDISDYDADFYDAAYKNMKVKFYVDGALKWVGWLKPENTTRQFDSPEVLYKVSATDGVNDLQNLTYDDYESSGKQSILQLIKNAIDYSGLDDVDFLIQCNLYEESIMVEEDEVFEEIQADNRRFYKIEDGESRPDYCYDVIEKCIKPFYCRMYMSDGYWKITNGQEYNSQYTIYDYDTLAASGDDTAHNREVDVSGMNYPVSAKFGELSKEPPVKKLRVVFRNKNYGDSEITNGDFSSGTSNWTNSGWGSFTVSGGEAITDEPVVGASDDKYIETDAFSLSNITENDLVEIRYKVKLDTITWNDPAGTRFPVVQAVLVDPDNNEIEGTGHALNVIGGEFTTIVDYISPTGNGNYKLRLYVKPHPTSYTDTLIYYWDDVEAIHRGTANTTSDLLSMGTLSASAYEEVEEIMHLLDSYQISDLGALSDGTNLTADWSRYGLSSESLSLVNLFVQQYLNDRQAHHDLLTAQLYDLDEEIEFNSILTYNSKKYRWVEMSKNFVTKLITGTLQQVDNSTDATFSYQEQFLTSVDGQSTGSNESSPTIGFATQAWVTSNFPGLSGTESITGAWTFTNTVEFTNAVTVSGSGTVRFENNVELYFGTSAATDFYQYFSGSHMIMNMTAEGDLIFQDDGAQAVRIYLSGANSGGMLLNNELVMGANKIVNGFGDTSGIHVTSSSGNVTIDNNLTISGTSATLNGVDLATQSWVTSQLFDYADTGANEEINGDWEWQYNQTVGWGNAAEATMWVDSTSKDLTLSLGAGTVFDILYGAENIAKFTPNAGINLYYNNSLKLQVVSGGVDITGTLDATTLQQGGTNINNLFITEFSDDTSPQSGGVLDMQHNLAINGNKIVRDDLHASGISVTSSGGDVTIDGGLTVTGNSLTVGGNAVATESWVTSNFLASAPSTLTISSNLADALNFTGASASDTRGISFNGKVALSADSGPNDGWLRLDNSGHFSSGVRTGGNLLVSGDLLVESGRGIDAVTGTYGTIQTTGSAKNGWFGYSIHGRAVFMEQAGNSFGLYNDTNNEWAIKCRYNAEVELYHNGVLKLETKSTGVEVTGTLNATSDIQINGSALDTIFAKVDDYTSGYMWIRDDLGTGALKVTLFRASPSASDYIQQWYFLNSGTEGDGSSVAFLDYTGELHAEDAVATSDIRLKKNIKGIGDDWYNKVVEVGKIVKQYDKLSVDKSHVIHKDEVGLIAQQVRKIMPEYVRGDEEEGYLHLSYQKMVAPLYFAIMKQHEEIEELKKRLDGK